MVTNTLTLKSGYGYNVHMYLVKVNGVKSVQHLNIGPLVAQG